MNDPSIPLPHRLVIAVGDIYDEVGGRTVLLRFDASHPREKVESAYLETSRAHPGIAAPHWAMNDSPVLGLSYLDAIAAEFPELQDRIDEYHTRKVATLPLLIAEFVIAYARRSLPGLTTRFVPNEPPLSVRIYDPRTGYVVPTTLARRYGT